MARNRKPFSIREAPNPTGLSMSERRLCMNMMHSLEDSVQEGVEEALRYGRTPDHVEIRSDVMRSAYRQLTGRQPGTGGAFTLKTTADVGDADMAYVLKSLGVE